IATILLRHISQFSADARSSQTSYPPTHSTLSSPSLFFSSYAPHRDLHSFPTRRSSDLIGTAATAAWIAFALQPDTELAVSGWRRSEEHTSELQSRFDLVCRLLLEKKKKKIEKLLNEANTKRSTEWTQI